MGILAVVIQNELFLYYVDWIDHVNGEFNNKQEATECINVKLPMSITLLRTMGRVVGGGGAQSTMPAFWVP